MEASIDDSLILEPEIEAPSLVSKSFWNMAIPFYTEVCSPLGRSGGDTREESRKVATKSDNVNIMGALLFLLLATLVGFVLYNIRGSRSF